MYLVLFIIISEGIKYKYKKKNPHLYGGIHYVELYVFVYFSLSPRAFLFVAVDACPQHLATSLFLPSTSWRRPHLHLPSHTPTPPLPFSTLPFSACTSAGRKTRGSRGNIFVFASSAEGDLRCASGKCLGVLREYHSLWAPPA